MSADHAFRRRPVVVIVTDESVATAVAHSAVWVASEQERPILLLVPIQRPAFTTDPAIVARMYGRALREAQALAGKVRPVLEAAGFSVPARVVWHGTFSLRRSRTARATALARAVRKAGAAAVVTPIVLPTPLGRGVEILFLPDDQARSRTHWPEGTHATSKERGAPMSLKNSTNPVQEMASTEIAAQDPGPTQRPPWTFLTNHSHVLLAVNENPRARVEDIAAMVGITPRATLHILADLEEAGYLQRLREGRRTRYVIQPRQHFRHPATGHQEIGALLAIFSPADGHLRKESS
ncbi:helix-turn-helix transcriptional regulator [Arthrobacter sp. CAN_A1]|uniref:helix-turn-helix transcriptional regulator n=1 Tax=Arthrobacter sp. CAN_A1 TaxID=2787717 RepID=UPI001A2BB653